MKITLKRALKLRKELEALVSKSDLPVSTTLSLLVEDHRTKPLETLAKARNVVGDKVLEQMLLSEILMHVRDGIALVNVQSGVEAALAEAGHIDRMIAIQKKIADTPTLSPQDEVVTAEMAMAVRDLEQPGTDRYSRPEKSLKIAVVSAEMRDNARQKIAELKRRKEAVEDKRTGLNATQSIELSDRHAELLTRLGLI